MDEEKSGNILTDIFDFAKEIWSEFKDIFPKVIKFWLWILAGVFIMPCMFVASVIYPMWEDWADEF